MPCSPITRHVSRRCRSCLPSCSREKCVEKKLKASSRIEASTSSGVLSVAKTIRRVCGCPEADFAEQPPHRALPDVVSLVITGSNAFHLRRSKGRLHSWTHAGCPNYAVSESSSSRSLSSASASANKRRLELRMVPRRCSASDAPIDSSTLEIRYCSEFQQLGIRRSFRVPLAAPSLMVRPVGIPDRM